MPIHLGDRKAIFDIYCTNQKGENFIVEMQKAEQKYFKDRTVFYSTFPIQQQARDKGSDWNFKLESVYTIGILNFEFKESEPNKYRHDVKLTEQQTKELFYDKLTYIYLEMTKFNKTEDELKTRFDKWMYVLKNLPKLDRVPVFIKEKIFLKLFKIAAIARMSPQEYNKYEVSLNSFRDIQSIKNTHYEKGMIKAMIKGEEKGRKEGKKLK